ncbi:MAG: hypothetical protein KDB90_02910 [Planctomycetes bacterium]|nr:hypothetical protein [Planctomycetota bacterium]
MTLGFLVVVVAPGCLPAQGARLSIPVQASVRVVSSVDEINALPESTAAIELVGGTSKEFAALGRLRNVRWLGLRRPIDFSDVECAVLSDLPLLERLDLISVPPLPDSKRLAPLTQCPRLKALNILGSGISADEVVQFSAKSKVLRELSCPSAIFDEEAACALREKASITQLTLSGNILPQKLSMLASLSTLTDLRLSGRLSQFAGKDALAVLAGLTELQHLELPQRLRCNEIALEWLQELPRLRELEVNSSTGLGAALGTLAGSLASLESLSIYNCEIDQVFFDQLARSSTITSLSIRNSSSVGFPPTSATSVPEDAWLVELSALATVQTLWLDECQNVTDVGLQALRRLESLSSLTLNGCVKCGDIAIACIGELEGLVSLRLSDVRLASAEGFAPLAKLGKLETLSLRSCSCARLDVLTDNATWNLQSLVLDDCRLLTTRQYQFVERITDLRELSLAGCSGLTTEVMRGLVKHLPDLAVLCVASTDVSDEGLTALRKAGKLKSLSLSYCRNLGCEKVLEVVAELPLTDLYVYGDLFSSDCVKKMQAVLPGCRIWE